jgi:hypothetical protein
MKESGLPCDHAQVRDSVRNFDKTGTRMALQLIVAVVLIAPRKPFTILSPGFDKLLVARGPLQAHVHSLP